MTVVYLDSFFLLNFVVNDLLLLCAGKLDGAVANRLRCGLGAALGSGYAVLSLLPAGEFLQHPACLAGSGVLMLLTAYGHSDRLLRTGGIFLVLSCALGGGLSLFMEPPVHSMRTILIGAALCYGILSLLLRGEFTHTESGGELVPLTLTRGSRSVTVTALRDTGNTLQDPLTGRPVVVIQGEKLRELLPELPLGDRRALENPVELLRNAGESDLRMQLLPYRAVGVERGLLLAVRMERAEMGTRTIPNCLTALSPTPVSDGGGYSALIGGRGEG